jgi:hypothetical protein
MDGISPGEFKVRQHHIIVKFVLILVIALASQWSFAQSDRGLERREFGLGMPENISDLPRGPFRESLEALTPSARAIALAKLQSASFPTADLEFMRVDDGGGVFYVDPEEYAEGEADAAIANELLLGEITEADVFKLHSKPGASRVLYIDFDGHQLIDTVWNGWSGEPILYMLPFSLDTDPYNFSAAEISRIAESWRRVSEDFSSWDIDVTTEEPSFTVLASGRIAYASNVGHNLVTTERDEFGVYVYKQTGCGCGGVAYLGAFGNSYSQPGLSFNKGDGSNAMTISHEFGHNLNLSHDGTSTAGYYSGHGSGATSWGPIMGAPFGKSIVTWSRASYPDANNNQDDRAVITGYLPARLDDHTDALLADATPLVVTGGTNVVSTTRVTDPGWSSLDNKGIIEDPSDYDVFYMSIGAGTISLNINSADADRFESNRGANLDIQARLLDSTGSELQLSNPDLATGASLNYAVTNPGTYYIEITGVGRAANGGDAGYDDYTSSGQYYISGTIPEDIVITDPPAAPDDLTAVLVGENSIELYWTDPAADPTANEAGYRVYRSINGAGSDLIATLPRDSEWYADNNLASGDYSYYVVVFNSQGSDSTAPTAPLTIDLPRIAVATSESTFSGSVTSGSYLSTQQVSGSETLSEQHSGGRPNRRVSSLDHEWTVSGVTPGSSVTVEVSASAPNNSEGDYFRFLYSVNGGTEAVLGTLAAGTGENNFTAELPGTTSGTVFIRVEDTDRTVGAGNMDTVSISRIRVVSSGDPEEQAPIVTIEAPVDGAVVLGGTEIVFIGIAEDYEDGNLSGAIVWSSDVDGSLGDGQSAAVVLSGGTPAVTHEVTATVTDSAGLSSSATIVVTVDDTPVATSMWVADLTGFGEIARNGKRWSADVGIYVVNDLGKPVSGATVSGSWSGDASGTGSCVTDATGICSITSGGLKIQNLEATFTVTGVAGSLAYDASRNVQTAITITP